MKLKAFGIVVTLVFFTLISASHASVVINLQGIGDDPADRTINITDFTADLFQGMLHGTYYDYPTLTSWVNVDGHNVETPNRFLGTTIDPEAVNHEYFGDWGFYDGQDYIVQSIPGVSTTLYTTSVHGMLKEVQTGWGIIHKTPTDITPEMIPLDGNLVYLSKPDEVSIPYALDISTFHFYDFTDDQFQGDEITEPFCATQQFGVWIDGTFVDQYITVTFGAECPPVPIPPSAFLLASGVIGLLWARKRGKLW
jgi:hypothetical protein